MPINTPNLGKKRTVPFRDAKGITRLVKVIAAGGSSGVKIRRPHVPTHVIDNVAVGTGMKQTNKIMHRRGPA